VPGLWTSTALTLAVAFALPSGAAEVEPLPDPVHLSADPDTPAMGASWRGRSHALAGADIPLYVAPNPKGFLVNLLGSIQLDNREPNAIPNNTWRGLLGVHVEYRLPLAKGGVLRLGGLVDHESDHETRYFPADQPQNPIGFYNRNSVAARAIWEIPLRNQRLTVKAVSRLHVATCNILPDVCAQRSHWGGSRTVELSLEAIWEANGGAHPTGRWGPFAALFLERLFPNGLVTPEARVVSQGGVWIRMPVGMFQVFGILWFGNDAGYLSHDHVHEIGLGLRWTL
jgi:hypothetical protein